MDDKQAIPILTEMLKKNSLNEDEKEALRTAIGNLSWTKLIEGTVKSRKARQEREQKRDEQIPEQSLYRTLGQEPKAR